MLVPHVSITLTRFLKDFHTEPADMCPALCAFHMIATLIFLNAYSAVWTIPHIVLYLVLSKEPTFFGANFLPLLASHSVVADYLALCADRSQTRGAEKLVICFWAVDLGTIWRWTVLEVIRSSADVGVE